MDILIDRRGYVACTQVLQVKQINTILHTHTVCTTPYIYGHGGGLWMLKLPNNSAKFVPVAIESYQFFNIERSF